MIFQQDFELFQIINYAEITGAIIATFFAILTWWAIEKLAKWREWRALVKAFNELYNLLLPRKYESNLSVELVNSIYEDIGEKSFKKILKLQPSLDKGLYKFEGNDFMIEAVIGIAGNHIKLYQYSMPIFDYRRPEEGTETHTNFMEYFKTQCRREKIKVK